MKPNKYIVFAYCVILLAFVCSCKKFLNVGAPATTLAENSVYTTNATASNVLTGIYTELASDQQVGGVDLPITSETYLGAASDELTHFGNLNDGFLPFYQNNLNSSIGYIPFWSSNYSTIFMINSAIEGIQGSTQLTASVKSQLLGEAYFLRGFFYFYLVNYFGGVPLALTTNYAVNNLLPRASTDSVYSQIIADLTQAEGLLSDKYLYSDLQTVTMDRLRPNKAVATALLARIYLYTKQYDKAITSATALISNTTSYRLVSPDSVFLKQSKEAIWQLQPVNSGAATRDAQVFTLPSTGPSSSYPLYLSSFLLDSFYPGDLRAKDWIDSVTVTGVTYYYPYKYKQGGVYNSAITSPAQMTEYQMVIRLAEMYLIRSEAELLGNGDVGNAVADLNAIRSRAGLGNYTGLTDVPSLQRELLRERQVEFFTEWGARWLDLKRTGQIDNVMQVVTPLKGGGAWNTDQQLLPLPVSDLQRDHNLVQNPGY